MMGRKDKPISPKEFYKLWWEYLRRSKEYQEFCDHYGELGEEHFGTYYQIFLRYMRFFGNIFEKSFDEWWEGPRRKKMGLPGSRPVLDLRDNTSYRSMYFKALDPNNDLSPSFSNKEKMLEIINTEAQYIFLAVPVVGREDMNTISKQIKKIRDSYKKTPAVKEADKELRKFTMPPPSSRLRSDELGVYLKIYDYRKSGLSMKDAIKKHDTSKDCNGSSVQREYYRFQEKAEAIIRNVENGTFPGKY